jgi:hypothetical protein
VLLRQGGDDGGGQHRRPRRRRPHQRRAHGEDAFESRPPSKPERSIEEYLLNAMESYSHQELVLCHQAVYCVDWPTAMLSFLGRFG